MKKLLILTLVAMFVVPVVAPRIFAAEETTQEGTTDVGNKLCPVSGDPVSGTSFVTYNGKHYGLCCPACEKMFLAEPEKYIAKMKEQEQAALQTTPATEEEHAQHHDMGM
ncbi:MAG: hypothetical protein WC530_03670 [Candidatus Omnitrophota bacterium]|jgi:YHS domain-containing protein